LKRIFFDGELKDSINIDGDYHHYLKNVVRVKNGERLQVMTKTMMADCVVESLDKRSSSLVVEHSRKLIKPDYRLVVYQSLLKREYMDFVIEKYSELGVTDIVPVISEYSLNELKDKTMQRFKDISVKAVLQSENEHFPVIHEAVKIQDIQTDTLKNLVFYERMDDQQVIKENLNDVSILIGPEGGLSEQDMEIITDKGFASVSPIKQILKAETAAVLFTGYIRILQG